MPTYGSARVEKRESLFFCPTYEGETGIESVKDSGGRWRLFAVVA